MAVPLELKSFPFSVWRKTHNKYLTDLIFLRTVSYVTRVFRSIYGPRASRLGHKSERKKHGLQLKVEPSNSVNKRYFCPFFDSEWLFEEIQYANVPVTHLIAISRL